MIKGIVQQENITILSIYAPNTGAPTFIKQLLPDLRNEIEDSAIIVGDFNTLLTAARAKPPNLAINWPQNWP